eukprot:scaffold35690_cov18-Tisochrysis_lutea.AAC.1
MFPPQNDAYSCLFLLRMMPGLLEGQEKMSKSDPNSAIFMEDTEQEVSTKIKKAYCPPKGCVYKTRLELERRHLTFSAIKESECSGGISAEKMYFVSKHPCAKLSPRHPCAKLSFHLQISSEVHAVVLIGLQIVTIGGVDWSKFNRAELLSC